MYWGVSVAAYAGVCLSSTRYSPWYSLTLPHLPLPFFLTPHTLTTSRALCFTLSHSYPHTQTYTHTHVRARQRYEKVFAALEKQLGVEVDEVAAGGAG